MLSDTAKYPKLGQGPATIADDESLAKDDLGFTHPNLHRRVDASEPNPESGEVSPREYSFGIYGVDSYRTTKVNTHDEESTTCEIP